MSKKRADESEIIGKSAVVSVAARDENIASDSDSAKSLASKTENKRHESNRPFSESQKTMIRDIFEEVYSVRKWRLFWLNFFRGIFLGFGTVVGGTVLVAIVVWVLSQTVDWFPAISEFTQRLIDSLSTGKP